jgi:hypothetical protein
MRAAIFRDFSNPNNEHENASLNPNLRPANFERSPANHAAPGGAI